MPNGPTPYGLLYDVLPSLGRSQMVLGAPPPATYETENAYS